MTRMDLTGPWATCIYLASLTQEEDLGSRYNNRRRFVEETPFLILDLLKCFWMNHQSYWCHSGLVSRILESITDSDGVCEGHKHYVFYEHLLYCLVKTYRKQKARGFYIYMLLLEGLENISCLEIMQTDGRWKVRSLFVFLSSQKLHIASQQRDKILYQTMASIIPNLTSSRNKHEPQARCLLRAGETWTTQAEDSL